MNACLSAIQLGSILPSHRNRGHLGSCVRREGVNFERLHAAPRNDPLVTALHVRKI